MNLTPLKDYQQRIPITDLRVGDFLDEIDPLPPARGARGGVRGAVFGSRVTRWDPITGELSTVAMDNENARSLPLAYRLRYRSHTCIIRKRADDAPASDPVAAQAAAFEAAYRRSQTARMLGDA